MPYPCLIIGWLSGRQVKNRKKKKKKKKDWGEAVVQWLRQMAHDQEIVNSNPGTVYWIDISNASYYIKEKLKIKVAKWGTLKNIKKKKKKQRSRTMTIFLLTFWIY